MIKKKTMVAWNMREDEPENVCLLYVLCPGSHSVTFYVGLTKKACDFDYIASIERSTAHVISTKKRRAQVCHNT